MAQVIKGKRWKMLLSLYLGAPEIPFECLSSQEKLDDMLLNMLYKEFESEVKTSDKVILKEYE